MKSFRKYIALIVSIALTSVSFSHVQAAMVTNDVILNQAHNSAKTELLQTINRADVKQRFISMGVKPEAVEDRIQLMTADEVAQLNKQIDELPAGGDVLGVILVVFIVFVITDVIGATDIFPFIKPVK